MAATHTEPREPWPVLIFRGGEWRKAMVHLVIDYGAEWDVMFLTFEDVSRECWTVSSQHIRARQNITTGRIDGIAEHGGPVKQEQTNG